MRRFVLLQGTDQGDITVKLINVDLILADLRPEQLCGNKRRTPRGHIPFGVIGLPMTISKSGLAQKISNLQRQIEEQAGRLLDERDRLIQQRLWLRNELDNVGAG